MHFVLFNIAPQCFEYQTTASDAGYDGDTDIRFLDRQNVTCGYGLVLTKFKLIDKGDNTFAYNYTCCEVSFGCNKRTFLWNILLFQANILSCAETTNQGTSVGNYGGIVQLDLQQVDCGSGKVLQQFTTYRQDDNNYGYVYTCCLIYDMVTFLR